MKEFKYKSLQGFEEISLAEQLDDFEAIGSKNLGTRYLFDFSAATPTSFGSDSNPGYFGKRFFDNRVIGGTAWDTYSGTPGHAEVLVKNLRVYDPVTITVPTPPANQHINQTISDITGEKVVPYWNENCMMYIDARQNTAYGSANNPNPIKYFRSGYIEITFKTDKANCILGYGSTVNSSTNTGIGGPSTQSALSGTLEPTGTTIIDSSNAYINEGYVALELTTSLKNGKLTLDYSSFYGSTKKSFTISSNATLADNEWHHVVINFNKPGTVIEYGKKTNQRLIEFWIDGQLDFKTTKYVNESQVFFPIIEWLMMDPRLAFAIPERYEPQLLGAETFDYSGQLATYAAWSELADVNARNFDDRANITAFRGAFNHFISGVNMPLDKYDIQQRYRLFKNYTMKAAKVFTASAVIVEPTVSSNKKKALKLFWNNLINEKAKNGVELDNNYQVECYSVTYKTLNSPTEIYNIDLANDKQLTILEDVRVVLKDNVFLAGPGKQSLYNNRFSWNVQSGRQIQQPGLSLNYYDATEGLDFDWNLDLGSKFSPYAVNNLLFSGVQLNVNDRILLTNQLNKKENGVYIFNGLDKPLTRSTDADSATKLTNAIVRVSDGYYNDTSWILSNQISSLSDNQEWIELEFQPDSQNVNAQPIFTTRWANQNGIERFIDLQQDININKYDLIVFMNYPENIEEIKEHAINYQANEVKVMYDNFIQSLKNVVAQGASLHVSSPKLAEDLGIVKKFTYINQALETSDARSAASSPFEVNENASRYFDTHRINQYNLATTVNGLTNKETYVLTDFICYVPEQEYDNFEYHAKYSYRQLGLQEGNEFFIPGLTIIPSTENANLPGFLQNQKQSKPLAVVAPEDILVGTVVTQLSNNYYNGSNTVVNPYDDYATTIIVHNNQLLGGQPVTGKIFINCVEDSYTFSREEYNKATIQVIPQNDPYETVARKAWQYSTKRLNRLPNISVISDLTQYGQTKPTAGGGGPLIQAPSSSSNGIIRSESDKDNPNYESDLYANISEEIYSTQTIPVLSMTWLGLKWLEE